MTTAAAASSIINRRRQIRLACRTLAFVVSLYIFAFNLNSQTATTMMILSNSSPSAATDGSTATDNNADGSTVSSSSSSSFNTLLNEYMALTAPKPTYTLTHYDPHFIGGFRNQHMRFVAFVQAAVQHNITQLLLPSIRWGDATKKGHSVGHEVLFDVSYWNKRAGEFGLPTLVRYEKDVLEKKRQTRSGSSTAGSNDNEEEVIPCFNVTSSMYSGLNEKKWRSSGIILRKYSIWDYLGEPSEFAHCKYTLDSIHSPNNNTTNNNSNNNEDNCPMTYLVPHGGTKMAGRLWWEYDAMQSHRNKPNENGTYPHHLPLEKAIYKLLIPSLPIRRAIRESLDEATAIDGTTTSLNKRTVVALHPRIEHDMLLHEMCNKYMPMNLTKIFESIHTMPKFDLLFMAVSKALVDGKPPLEMERKPELIRLAVENRVTLENARKYGVFGTKERRGIPMLESGSSTASKIEFPVMEPDNTDGSKAFTAQSLGVTELVASVVNFFTALEADAFVGVRGSTYSQDAFSVRYYQYQDRNGGGGDEGGENNFVVGPNGMRQLFGPAEPLPCK